MAMYYNIYKIYYGCCFSTPNKNMLSQWQAYINCSAILVGLHYEHDNYVP